MADWKSKLSVFANGQLVSPIDSFTPTFATKVDPIHSIEADNVGALFHPMTATFTMTVKAIGPSVALLTKLAIEGTKFEIHISEEGSDWSFKSLAFRDCLITSCNPSNLVVDGVPAATFSGIILGFTGKDDQQPAS